MYLVLCAVALVYFGYELGTVKAGVILLATSSLFSVAGFYIGHRVGYMQTTDLMKKRVQQVGAALPEDKNKFVKRLNNAYRNKRLGGK